MTHGTPSGYSMGCRCVDCTRAQCVRMREYRNRRRIAGSTSEPIATTPGNQSGPASGATDRDRGNQERGS